MKKIPAKRAKPATWLRDRLKEIDKTAASLARYLKVKGHRVYEILGGRRSIQPHEVDQLATFLGWDRAKIQKHLPPDQAVLLATPKIKTVEQRLADLDRRIALIEKKMG